MNAILYLARREFINSVKDLLHHPGRLITYLFVGVMLVFSVVGTSRPQVGAAVLDLRLLQGIFLAILLFFGGIILHGSLKSGTTFFTMSDVTFLFVSPVSPKKILAYGMAKQMGSTLLMVVFFLFYGAMAVERFGVSWGGMALLLGGLVLALFLLQVTGLLIYGFVNGRPKRVRAVRICLYAVVGAMLAVLAWMFTAQGMNQEALLRGISSPLLELMPIVGWVKGTVFGLLTGNTLTAALYGAVFVLLLGAELWVFVYRNVDYYEDVLETTQLSYQVKQASKNKSGVDAAAINAPAGKPARVRTTGLHRGWGASAFFYRHLCEARRRSRLVLVGASTLVLFIVGLALCFFMGRSAGAEGTPIPPGVLLLITTAVLCYVQYFMNAAGDWSRELMKPYIYLAPSGSFEKLLWASMTTLIKPVIDGVLVFTALGVYLRAKPLTVLICIFIYASAGLMFTAGNILSQRMFGRLSNRGVIMLFYVFLLLLLFAPGVGGSVALLALGGGTTPAFLAGLPFVLWNIAAALGVIAACRNLLNTAEMG